MHCTIDWPPIQTIILVHWIMIQLQNLITGMEMMDAGNAGFGGTSGALGAHGDARHGPWGTWRKGGGGRMGL